MTLSVVRLVVVLAAVVALVGSVGLVGAEVNTTSDEFESNNMGDMASHMSGDMIKHMADHMDANMIEMMQDHMADHDHSDYHDGEAGHC